MDQGALRLFGGLFWYLDARNWAFAKMKASPHGSNLFDLRMHHSLFFVNLMSATDHVGDYLKVNREDREVFFDKLKAGFGNNDDYNYVRELRNAVVHRGFDPSASGHSDQTTLYVLCPVTVEDRNGKAYSCTFKYLRDLAQKCLEAIDPVITDVLERLKLFDPILHEPNRSETMNAIDSSTEMPDWAKELAKQTFARMDFDSVAAEVAKSHVDKMRTLLWRP